MKTNLFNFKSNFFKFNVTFIKRTMSGAETKSNIKEGQAEILVEAGAHVFYNPVQEFNRDLSVAVLNLCTAKYFGNSNKPQKESIIITTAEQELAEKPRNIRVLEALSATGLRSIRYAKEVRGLTEVIANDLSAIAVENIKANIKHNGVEDLVKTSHGDAVDLMQASRHPDKRFHAVDVDPYGCPSIFLDSAVQSVVDGGVLLVTCTDMAVLCGNTPNTCYVKYGSLSLKNKACHEMALRIVLQNIESHATRYKRYIVPLLSISADFYIRVFVQLFTSAVACKNTTSKLSMVYQCTGCETLTLQPLGMTKTQKTKDGQQKQTKHFLPHAPAVTDSCIHCGSRHHMGGPIWTAPMHNPAFVAELADVVAESDLGTKRRLEGVLGVIREELHDVPLYYSLDRLCSTVHATSMPMMTFRSALMNAGYRVSYSHASKTSVKTDASASVIWDVIRAWTKEHPVSAKKLAADAVTNRILTAPLQTEISFNLRRDANPLSRELGLVRYQENPAPFWGPGTRAIINTEQPDKKSKNQNKKRKRQLQESSDLSDQSEHDAKNLKE